MKKLITFLSQKKTLIIFAVIFILTCILANTIFQSSITYLTQTYNYTYHDAKTLLDSAGAAGRTDHLFILFADFIMIICYTCFLIGINYRLSCKIIKNCHRITIITFLPLLLSLDQLLEIIGMAILIFGYPTLHTNLIRSLNFLTITKYFLTPIFFILPFFLWCITIVVSKKKGMIHSGKH